MPSWGPMLRLRYSGDERPKLHRREILAKTLSQTPTSSSLLEDGKPYRLDEAPSCWPWPNSGFLSPKVRDWTELPGD